VSSPGDHVREMPSAPLLDDATIDAILGGDRVPPGVDHLATVAAGVRALGERPPPRPSPELAALLTHGMPVAPPGRATRATARHRRRPALATASGLGLAAKVGVATTAAVASLAGAAAAGVLPGDTDAPVRKAIEVFTPVEFTEDGDPLDHGVSGTEADWNDPSEARDHGDDGGLEERDDADEPGADGERGDDDPGTADQAPGAEHPHGDPAEPSDTDAGDTGPDDGRQGGPADATDAERIETPATGNRDD
jgi:hypothetical protein